MASQHLAELDGAGLAFFSATGTACFKAAHGIPHVPPAAPAVGARSYSV